MMPENKFIRKLKKLPGQTWPYVSEVAAFVCKNTGIPGGAMIADVITGVNNVKNSQDLEKIDEVLEIVMSQGTAIINFLAEKQVDPKKIESALMHMTKQNNQVHQRIESMAADLKGIPGMMAFLSERLDGISDQLDRVSGQIDTVGHELQGVARVLGTGQQEILFALQEVRQRIDLKSRSSISDGVSIRTDIERKMVTDLLERLRALPAEIRDNPELLNQQGQVLLAAGDTETATRYFEKAVDGSKDDARRGLFIFNEFQALIQNGKFDTAAARYEKAVKLNPAECELFDSDRYRIVEILGAGAFGIAFLCKNQIGQERVIKSLTGDGFDPDNIFTEAKLLRDIRSPFIARVYEWGWARRSMRQGPFVVTEYAGRHSLQSYVEKHQPLTPQAGLPVLAKICEGLQEAHHQGIIHRDLKPENIVVSGEKDQLTPRIIDFGLGLRSESLGDYQRSIHMQGSVSTLIGREVSGTLQYAPPEQKGESNAPITPCSDVFSFGKTANFLFFGTPQPLMRHWRNLPEPLVEILERCQEPAPQDRYQDFAEVSAALKKLITPDAANKPVENQNAGSKIVSPPPNAIQTPPAAVTPSAPSALPPNPAASMNPPTAEAVSKSRQHFSEGIRYQNTQDFERAETAFSEAIRFDPTFADAYIERAKVYIALKKTTEAFRDQVLVVRLDPIKFNTLNFNYGQDLTDADLKIFDGLTQLRGIVLTSARQITDDGLAHLRDIKSLQTLNLSQCIEISDAGLEYFKGNRELAWVWLTGCRKVTDNGLSCFTDATGLKQLQVEFTQTRLQAVESFPELQTINIQGCSAIQDADLSKLSSLPKLKFLSLAFCSQLSDPAIAALAPSPNRSITQLMLNSTGLTDTGLGHLKNLQGLSSLYLDQIQSIKGSGLAELQELPDLLFLSLNSMPAIDDEALAHVGKITSLKSLSLNQWESLSSKSIAYLNGLNRLEMLTLSGSLITDDGLAQLNGLKNLKNLILFNCRCITDQGLTHIANFKNLKNLNLRNSPVSKEAVETLSKNLPDCQINA